MTVKTTVFLFVALALQVRAQVPNKPADYQLNHSTIIMPCNNSGESAAAARAAAARAAAGDAGGRWRRAMWRRRRCWRPRSPPTRASRRLRRSLRGQATGATRRRKRAVA